MYRLLTRLHNCVTLVVKANTFFFPSISWPPIVGLWYKVKELFMTFEAAVELKIEWTS